MTTPANPSLQSQILTAVVAKLRTAGSWPSFRCRMSAFDSSELPAFDTLPEEGESEYEDTISISRRFRFNVRHVGQAVDQVDLIVDPLYVAGQQVLFADPTLEGLVRYIREISQKWDLQKGELDTCALVVTYQAEFDTSRSDPSQPPL